MIWCWENVKRINFLKPKIKTRQSDDLDSFYVWVRGLQEKPNHGRKIIICIDLLQIESTSLVKIKHMISFDILFWYYKSHLVITDVLVKLISIMMRDTNAVSLKCQLCALIARSQMTHSQIAYGESTTKQVLSTLTLFYSMVTKS